MFYHPQILNLVRSEENGSQKQCQNVHRNKIKT